MYSFNKYPSQLCKELSSLHIIYCNHFRCEHRTKLRFLPVHFYYLLVCLLTQVLGFTAIVHVGNIKNTFVK